MSINDSSTVRVRMSVRELQENPVKLNTFLKAFSAIQALSSDNPNSFWAIAGYHGEPFKPRKVPDPGSKKDTFYWNGWCQHNNVLFLAWHRFYCLRLENALRTVCPNDDVTLPYWDQTSPESLKGGLPHILTDVNVLIDGVLVQNPLRTFRLPKPISSPTNSDEYYEKPKYYEVVRYPYSGIQSPPSAKAIGEKHNQGIQQNTNTAIKEMLDENICASLKENIHKQYKRCLNASTYTSFSNRVSSAEKLETSLEIPHDSMHLAVGGFTSPKTGEHFGLIDGANGDMGENETAAFDPVFFLHHCNVDRVFWLWQQRHQCTFHLEIDATDKGANPSNGQGPTPFQHSNQHLNMDTVLHPFQQPNGLPVTSHGCINIQDIGYTYTPGSLQEYATSIQAHSSYMVKKMGSFDDIPRYLQHLPEGSPRQDRYIFNISFLKDMDTKFPYFNEEKDTGPLKIGGNSFTGKNFMKVHNVNRDLYSGSFFVFVYYKKGEAKKILIDRHGVLDRWNPTRCQNCMQHRVIDVVFELPSIVSLPVKLSDITVEAVYSDPKSGKRVAKGIEIAGMYEDDEDKDDENEEASNEKLPCISIYSVFTVI